MSASLSPGRKVIARALVIGCAAFAVVSAPAPAVAATPPPCWKTLMTEWYGGSIKHIYPIHCYHDALGHLPLDVATYSNARSDILRALQQAIAYQNKTSTPVTTVEPAPTTTGTATTPKTHKRSGLPEAIRKLTPGGADAFPLPLLILGFLAMLLVLAGLGGMGWRRYQSRRGTP